MRVWSPHVRHVDCWCLLTTCLAFAYPGYVEVSKTPGHGLPTEGASFS